ncbi:CPBP family intramembrane metalloprotease [Arthrobacter gandavensis]|uniref:CPBP family intramembrane glutamic endopeptidase n=1 Tax=Arthrobacter gandavensis TaxID=169960 RepID=UPI00188E3C88|nr:CPBP family intramembrane glutamic endopeptidase [Arthrobacter gandavensis]MBF4994995.1 CPBP family intramembrane metalloprotease [Arthrobacter gandavensis]
MTDTRIARQFTVMTFVIAYGCAGALIIAARFGYEVNNVVTTVPEFVANVPFAVYILSPAIASYLVLRRNGKVSGPAQWLKLVFAARGRPTGYLLVASALVVYFSLHLLVSGPSGYALPWFMFFLSLPGNLIIGGMEEAGWMTSLQPQLCRRWGYAVSSLVVGILWLLWHVPLFFIPGTNHESGVIDFWLFAVQILAFRFLYGAVLLLSPRNAVFLCILFHTMFNAASFTLGVPPATWTGTLAANAAVLALAVTAVVGSGRSAAAEPDPRPA